MVNLRHKSPHLHLRSSRSASMLAGLNSLKTPAAEMSSFAKVLPFLCSSVIFDRVSVKAGTPPGTYPEPHPEHPEPYPEHPEPYPEHPEPHPEHPEPHPEHAGIRAMKQRTCFSINSRVSHLIRGDGWLRSLLFTCIVVF